MSEYATPEESPEIKKQLQDLKTLRDEGLIEPQVYTTRQMEILRQNKVAVKEPQKILRQNKVELPRKDVAVKDEPQKILSETPTDLESSVQYAHNVKGYTPLPLGQYDSVTPKGGFFSKIHFAKPKWTSSEWLGWGTFLFLHVCVMGAILGVCVHIFGDSFGHVKGGIPFFAVGQHAVGIIAVGQFAVGIITVGQIGIGVINISQVGIGLLFSAAMATASFGVTLGIIQVGTVNIRSIMGLNLFKTFGCILGINLFAPFFDPKANMCQVVGGGNCSNRIPIA